MKSKTKTYVLIAVVLAVWGTIGYKIITGLDPKSPDVIIQDTAISFTPKKETVVETFSIQEMDRDPFLGTLTTKKKRSKTTKASSKKEEVLPEVQISYAGLVKKQQSNQQIFVVNINSRQYLLKKGQSAADVTLVRGNAKEIVVRYKNKNQVIPLQ